MFLVTEPEGTSSPVISSAAPLSGVPRGCGDGLVPGFGEPVEFWTSATNFRSAALSRHLLRAVGMERSGSTGERVRITRFDRDSGVCSLVGRSRTILSIAMRDQGPLASASF